MDRKAHWERIYAKGTADRASWYQPHLTTSLRLIAATGVGQDAKIIDVGGGDSTLVDDLLEQGFKQVAVLDVSPGALERARARLGDRARSVTWISQDVTDTWPTRKFDVWHDRAVFHFLTDADDRREYVRAMNERIRANGHAIVATFALDAPRKCSGLDVVRYSPETLSAELGPDFELVETLEELHQTPGGVQQPFVYCRFVK